MGFSPKCRICRSKTAHTITAVIVPNLCFTAHETTQNYTMDYPMFYPMLYSYTSILDECQCRSINSSICNSVESNGCDTTTDKLIVQNNTILYSGMPIQIHLSHGRVSSSCSTSDVSRDDVPKKSCLPTKIMYSID